MIDTINIQIPKEAVVIPDLERVRWISSDWGTTMTGNFHNLRVNANDSFVSVSGSSQKFNRCDNSSFSDCIDSINSLCDAFSLEPSEAIVKRIDIAKTVTTSIEPKLYYSFLGNHRSYYRNPHKGSLNYSNSLRTLSFYDKGKEQHIHGNYLRYEQRFFKPEAIFKKKLFLADLLTEEVYNHFLQSWRDDYSRIQKVKQIIPMKHFKTPKQFYNYMIALGASEAGDIFTQIKVAQRSGALNKVNAKRIRDKMYRINKSDFFEDNALIKELDNKILSE